MSCPESGQRQEAGAPNGWRDRCLRDTPRPPHATAREYASKGLCRNSLRNPNDLRGRERIAHHNLALRPVPRPHDAAGEPVVRGRDFRAIPHNLRSHRTRSLRPAANRSGRG